MAEKSEDTAAETVTVTLRSGTRITCEPDVAEKLARLTVNESAVVKAPAKKAAAKKSSN